MNDRVDPTRWGVYPGYHEYSGRWHEPPPETVAQVLDAMGAGPGEPPPPGAVTVRVDRPPPELGPGVVRTEDGHEIRVEGRLEPVPPFGYHHFVPDSGESFDLLVCPGSVPLPPGRQWGFSAQLYAARSRSSWGIGDLGDLAELNRWASGLGAGFTLINPVHAATPGSRQEPSPYFPGSRCFTNPIYIAVEAVPGAGRAAGLARAAAAGRALNAERRIDRDRVWAIKSAALEEIFAAAPPASARFDEYRAVRGPALERFASFQALSERFGTPWREWPGEYRRPDSPAVAAYTRSVEGSRRARYHAWLQWLAESQTEEADRRLGLVADLAVGVDPSGPDSWIWQDSFVDGFRAGAPPDEFNTLGQDWGFSPFDPWRLRSGGYAPWIEALRAAMAHGRGIRIDHVMGLFRLFWIPPGADPSQGLYVRYPSGDLLNILALEAERAGAFVVGEDLGTVEPEVRRDLGERRVLSYRIWWFEDAPTREWPEMAMGAVTTHDLPTVAGVLTGSDLKSQRDIGMEPNEESSAALLRKLHDRAGPGAGGPEEVIDAVYQDLAEARCYLLTATLDDVLAVEERPNMPGTVGTWPNWCLALPAPLEELEEAPLGARLAEHLRRGT